MSAPEYPVNVCRGRRASTYDDAKKHASSRPSLSKVTLEWLRMTRRSTRAELDAAAADAMARALSRLGYSYDTDTRVLQTGRGSVELRVIGIAIVSAPLRTALKPEVEENLVVVADVIVADARAALDQIGVGWLDRRGHLRLPFPGIEIDTDLDPLPRQRNAAATDTSSAVRGRAGLAVAVEALIAAAERRKPDTAGAVAQAAGIARQVAYRTLDQMRSAYLIQDDGQALVPELFWETARSWRSEWVPLQAVPEPDELDFPIAETGTRVAARFGALIVFTADWPRELYVPAPHHLTRLIECYGMTDDTRAARVAVAPARNIFAHLSDPLPDESFPMTHPVVAALDLATDPSRGVEAIQGWIPGHIGRVW